MLVVSLVELLARGVTLLFIIESVGLLWPAQSQKFIKKCFDLGNREEFLYEPICFRKALDEISPKTYSFIYF